MRAVADTNIVVSGLLWQGPPRQVLNLARAGSLELFTSPVLLVELEACALATRAEVIISGDMHLRSLGAFRGIRIVTAADFLL